METIKTFGRGFFGEPYALLKEGVSNLRSKNRQSLLALILALIAALADGVSTYVLLHPSQGETYIEGNPLASFIMDLVGVNTYIIVGNMLTLLVLSLVLAARPRTALQKLVWYGGAATILLKVLAGAWNTHLFFLIN